MTAANHAKPTSFCLSGLSYKITCLPRVGGQAEIARPLPTSPYVPFGYNRRSFGSDSTGVRRPRLLKRHGVALFGRLFCCAVSPFNACHVIPFRSVTSS